MASPSPRTPRSPPVPFSPASPFSPRSPSPAPTAAELDALPLVSTSTLTHALPRGGGTVTATVAVRSGLVASISASARVARRRADALVAALLDAGPVVGTAAVVRTRTVREDDGGGRSVREVDARGGVAFSPASAPTRALVTADVGAGLVAFSLSAQGGALRSAEGRWSVQEVAGGGAVVALSLTLVPALAPRPPHDALLAPLLARQTVLHFVRVVTDAARWQAAAPVQPLSADGAVTPRVAALPVRPRASVLFPGGLGAAITTALTSARLAVAFALTSPLHASWAATRSPLLVRVALRANPPAARSSLRSHPVARRPRRTAAGDAAWHVPAREAERARAATAWARVAGSVLALSVVVAVAVLASLVLRLPLASVRVPAVRLRLPSLPALPAAPPFPWLRPPPPPPPPPPPAHALLEGAKTVVATAADRLAACPATAAALQSAAEGAARVVDVWRAVAPRVIGAVRPAQAPPAQHWFCGRRVER